ncbi:MAG TPA: YciI family protein [Gemmatimonadaceae bacterium]|nr:YciI family protein [Gemmatimonadaceae bacterium]
MPDYMLLLHERPELFANVTPDDMERVIAKYVEWRTKLGAAGKLTGGNKLRDDAGRIIEARSPGGRVEVRDGPFTETKDVIGGYFIVNAADYDEAIAISRDCPHLAFGGRIELREIEIP